MEDITLTEVLAAIDSGETIHEIEVVTYNSKQQVGGEWIKLRNCRKHGWLSPEERNKQSQYQPSSSMAKKNPRHYDNSTRNLYLLANGEIRKIHIRLIRKFNGKTVL